MKLHVSPVSALQGTVRIPGSKSQSVRALLVATLAEGKSRIHGLPAGDDVSTALQLCKDLGAVIETLPCHERCVSVESRGVPLRPPKESLWTSNSGITTRFVLPILGLCTMEMQLNAGEQMQKRPMESLLKNLEDMGVSVERGWPLKVSGKLVGGKTQVDGLTSQFLSALLLSGCYAEENMELSVEDLNERPYVEMTLKWLSDAGLLFKHTRDGKVDRFVIQAGQKYSPIDYTVPGDFSSASLLLVAGALLPGALCLEGLDMTDPQGDRRLVEILKSMGADVEVQTRKILLRGGKPLKGIRVDANDIPDLVPALAVLGTQAEGQMEILNVPQARFKETDRLHSMTEGLRKMGARVEEKEDGLVVWKSELKGAAVRGYEDHRTIMALTVAGLLANGETVVDTAEGIEKTYPQFGDQLNQIGATLHLQ